MISFAVADNSPWVPVISALAGVCLASLVNLIQNWMTSRANQKQQIRDLAVKLAIEKWKYEAPLRNEMRQKIGAKLLKDHPHDMLPTIPGISLNQIVTEMIVLLENIPTRKQEKQQDS